MKILSWNCHGLGRLRAVQELEELISSLFPCLVLLMETKDGRQALEDIRVKKWFSGLFYVPHVNHGGGIAFLWKEENMVQLLYYGHNFIDARINLSHFPTWRLTGFYGLPKSSRHQASWELLW